MLFGVGFDVAGVDDEGGAAAGDEAGEIHLPDLLGGFFGEGGVVQRDVDAGGEGFVEETDFVGC